MGRKATVGRIALLPWGRKGFHSNKEWWTRTMWALEATASANDRLFGYGTAMLTMLAQSSDASKEEKGLLDAVWATAGTQMQDAAISRLFAERSVPLAPACAGRCPFHTKEPPLYTERFSRLV